MKSNIQTSIEPVVGGGNGFGWILLLLQLLTVPFAMWGFFALLQDRNSDSAEFIAMTVLLVSAATAYIALRGLRRMAWTSLPDPFDNRDDDWVCHHARSRAICDRS